MLASCPCFFQCNHSDLFTLEMTKLPCYYDCQVLNINCEEEKKINEVYVVAPPGQKWHAGVNRNGVSLCFWEVQHSEGLILKDSSNNVEKRYSLNLGPIYVSSIQVLINICPFSSLSYVFLCGWWTYLKFRNTFSCKLSLFDKGFVCKRLIIWYACILHKL